MLENSLIFKSVYEFIQKIIYIVSHAVIDNDDDTCDEMDDEYS